MGTGSPLVAIAGTGTGIGKTHVSAALLRAWGERSRVVGYKPVETGVVGETGTNSPTGNDSRRLLEASTFHVKHPVFRQTFADPISPHLAARRMGTSIDLVALAKQATELRREADGVVVELAGGLLTPLAPGALNADLARKLDPTRVVLVAPDRLGVLHDVGATLHATARLGLGVFGIVLSAVANPDASSGTNAMEITQIFGASILATFPWAEGDHPFTRRAARELFDRLNLGLKKDETGRREGGKI
jgi:dethiobiotin synthetase